MRKLTLIVVFAASLLPAAGRPGLADERDHWRGDIHRFHEHDFAMWQRGRWRHEFHDGRLGWWWVVGGVWYFYPAPVYPYPDPFLPPGVPVAAGPTWYYCASPPGYYPYVAACLTPWQAVPAGLPPPVVAAPPPVVAAPPPVVAAPPPPVVAAPPPEPPGANTVVGTIAGAVVGGVAGSQFGHGSGKLAATAFGTLLGAFVGHKVGESLDQADQAAAQQAAQRAYQAPIGQQITWTNPDSGHSGTITPSREGNDASGNYCREFQQTVTVAGNTEQAVGTACRMPDGSWKIVNQ